MQDAVADIVVLLRNAFAGTDITTFYNGEPDDIPNFNLPCIVVTKKTDTTTLGATGFDVVKEQLTIKVVLNKADDLGDGVQQENLTERRIRDYIDKRAENGDYEVATIKGALRRNLHFGTTPKRRISNDVTVEIGTLLRPNDLITAEGHVGVTVTTNINVMNRS